MSRERIKKKIRRLLGKEGNNRGAAMISVLIAVAFIAVLATSLLYLAYMNYLTKAMRYGSTDDFYTSEYAIDELASTLQQVAVDKGNAGGNISDAITEIGKAVSANSGKYNNAQVESLLKAATNNATISVNTAVTSGNNYVTTSNSVTLKGVVVTSTSPQGYVNTVRTDITINFRPQGEGSLDINDFSVISDSPIRCGGDAGDLILSGCIYTQKNSATSSVLGVATGTAMQLDNHAVVQMIGDKAVINGDLVIGSACTLLVSCDTVVYGDVKIGNDSTLIILDKFKVTGDIKKTGTGEYKVADASKLKTKYKYDGNEIPGYGSSPKYTGLVNRLFCSEVWFYDKSVNNWKAFDFETYLQNGNQKNSNVYDVTKDESTGDGVATGGPYLQVDLSDAAHNFNNTLVLGTNRMTKTHHGAKKNTTFTTTKGVFFNSESGSGDTSIMQRMNDADYQKVLDSCIALPFGNSVYCTNEDGTWNFSDNNAQADFSFATDTTFRDMVKDGGSYDNSKRKVKKDGDRTYVYYDGKNYLPTRYLLDDNTRQMIDAIFSASADTSDPTTSFVEYDNWEKR